MEASWRDAENEGGYTNHANPGRPLTPLQKVTCVHKANIMKLGDGLFLNTCKRIAEQEYGHTGIKFDSMIVDNTSMQLVSKPQQFDVMVMPNVSIFYLSLAFPLTPSCTVLFAVTLDLPLSVDQVSFRDATLAENTPFSSQDVDTSERTLWEPTRPTPLLSSFLPP